MFRLRLSDLGLLRRTELHLFDTFSGMPGMPELADHDPCGHARGDFGDNSEEAVPAQLRDFPFIRTQPGIIPGRLLAVASRQSAFVHVDVDLYQTGLDCAEFFSCAW